MVDLGQRILEAVFPRFCVDCGVEGSLLCGACDAGWNPEKPKVLESEEELRESELRKLWALLPYANPVARELITSWKYNYDQSAWEILKKRLAPQLATFVLTLGMNKVEAIVPLPLSKQRKCERGFDQAEEIAKWLSKLTGVPMMSLLEKRRTVGHQADRSVEERLAAMVDSPFSFSASPDPSSCPQRVLLVDDVWTTGATMAAGARTLKAAGVEEVFGLTLARGK